MERFGKPSGPLIDARSQLLWPSHNDDLVARTQRLYNRYRMQPRRTGCKICVTPLSRDPIFEKFNVPYFLCSNCGHVNGGFKDTAEFNDFMFTGDGSDATVSHYSEKSEEAFQQRVTDIYMPKVEFLFQTLSEVGKDPARLGYADLGAGTGHFVAALRQAGALDVFGYDVSQQQTELGNRILGANVLRLHGMDELEDIAQSVATDVVSLIFTLEHLEHPRRLMLALQANANVKFLFISVPTVSPAMIMEMVFPTVFERQMSTHTHLFSHNSLCWLAESAGFAPIGEWWFGSDVMDLYRSVAVRLRQTNQSEAGLDLWTNMMRPIVDDWQIALDRRRWSSAVHMVLRRTF